MHDKLWIGHPGDDEVDDPCLSEALLQVSDEFDSRVAYAMPIALSLWLWLQPQAVVPANQTRILAAIACASPITQYKHMSLWVPVALLLPLVEEDR